MERAWYTTEQAAEYLATSKGALLNAIYRGLLKPDAWGGRGRGRCHRFRQATLDAYITGEDTCQAG